MEGGSSSLAWPLVLASWIINLTDDSINPSSALLPSFQLAYTAPKSVACRRSALICTYLLVEGYCRLPGLEMFLQILALMIYDQLFDIP